MAAGPSHFTCVLFFQRHPRRSPKRVKFEKWRSKFGFSSLKRGAYFGGLRQYCDLLLRKEMQNRQVDQRLFNYTNGTYLQHLSKSGERRLTNG